MRKKEQLAKEEEQKISGIIINKPPSPVAPRSCPVIDSNSILQILGAEVRQVGTNVHEGMLINHYNDSIRVEEVR